MKRLIDHLCQQHTEAALNRWPIAGDFSDLLDQCPACDRIALQLHPLGSYSIRCLPELDHRTYEHSDAIHEAAHAVLGLIARMPLLYVLVLRRTDAIEAEPSSHVKWGPYSTPFDEWAAMAWAGQQAQRRWFTEHGLISDANLVDIANQGCHDTALVLKGAAVHGLPEDAGWDLCSARLAEHWDTIVDVAGVLVDRGRLSGDEVADLADVACRT